jgi:VWFA-related protein
VLRPKDLAFLISFGSDSELLQDLTGSPTLLQQGLAKLRIVGGGPVSMTPPTLPLPGGGRGTVLYEAVWLASMEKLRAEVGRKVIVLITDGVDTGSRVKVEQAIEEAQKSDTIVYGILYEDPRYTYYQGASGEGVLKRMAQETGGRVFRVERDNTLTEIFKAIQEEVRTQYTVAFPPANSTRDGSYRKIEIRTPKNRNLRVQARRGYYATKDSQ